jgi:CheY-like chemotaxis protein
VAELATVGEQAAAPELQVGGTAESILLVEDDDHIASLLQALLTDAGYSVLRARNGAVALRSLESSTPAAIILDLMMPVMDGWTFLARYREHRTSADIPIVVVSAVAPVQASAEELGVRAVLAKPFNIEDVVDAITDITGHTRTR